MTSGKSNRLKLNKSLSKILQHQWRIGEPSRIETFLNISETVLNDLGHLTVSDKFVIIGYRERAIPVKSVIRLLEVGGGASIMELCIEDAWISNIVFTKEVLVLFKWLNGILEVYGLNISSNQNIYRKTFCSSNIRVVSDRSNQQIMIGGNTRLEISDLGKTIVERIQLPLPPGFLQEFSHPFYLIGHHDTGYMLIRMIESTFITVGEWCGDRIGIAKVKGDDHFI